MGYKKASQFSVSFINTGSSNLAVNTAYYCGVGNLLTSVATVAKYFVPCDCNLFLAHVGSYMSKGTAEAWAWHIRVNNTTNYLIATNTDDTGNRTWYNSNMNVPLSVGDYIELYTMTPNWVTPPTVFKLAANLTFKH